jgi:hypothetical protein
MKIADTATIKRLAEKAEAKGRNRALHEIPVSELDPTGVHVCSFQMPHEHQGGRATDLHLRTMWFLKMKESDVPTRGSLDIDPSDYESLSEHEPERAVA